MLFWGLFLLPIFRYTSAAEQTGCSPKELLLLLTGLILCSSSLDFLVERVELLVDSKVSHLGESFIHLSAVVYLINGRGEDRSV